MEELLKTAFGLLSEGSFDEATRVLDQILAADSKNARAYLGRLMAERKVKSPDALSGCIMPLEGSKNYQAIMQFGDDDLKAEAEGYNKKITEALQGLRRETTYNKGKARMAQDSLEDYTAAEAIFESLGDYKDSALLKEESAEKVILYTPDDKVEDKPDTKGKKFRFNVGRFVAFVAAAAVVAGIIAAVVVLINK